jgi:hypothetical protein
MRGANLRPEPLWRLKAKEEGRLRKPSADVKSGHQYQLSRTGAVQAWQQIVNALKDSERLADRKLAADIKRYMDASPFGQEFVRQKAMQAKTAARPPIERQRVPVVSRGQPSRRLSGELPMNCSANIPSF